MKINLERNIYTQRGRLRCAICEGDCRTDAIRPLLCHDDNAIVGDICADCLRQPLELIQLRLRDRAAKLIAQPQTAWQDRTLSSLGFALELSEISHQPLSKPPFYAWCWQWLKIAISETIELEAARMSKNCPRRSKPLKIKFLEEEPSIED